MMPDTSTEALPPLEIACLTFDCSDPDALASFWCNVLGYTLRRRDAWAVIADPARTGMPICFLHVPEGKQAKNRMHLDLRATDIRAEADRLVRLGARELATFEDHIVLADPEGNEFCVCSPVSLPARQVRQVQPRACRVEHDLAISSVLVRHQVDVGLEWGRLLYALSLRRIWVVSLSNAEDHQVIDRIPVPLPPYRDSRDRKKGRSNVDRSADQG